MKDNERLSRMESAMMLAALAFEDARKFYGRDLLRLWTKLPRSDKDRIKATMNRSETKIELERIANVP